MGVVSVLFTFGMFGALAVILHLLAREVDSPPWMTVLLALVIFGITVGALGIYNNVFQRVKTPFDPKEVELPERPRTMAEPTSPEVQDVKPRALEESKKEHQEALQNFEERAL